MGGKGRTVEEGGWKKQTKGRRYGEKRRDQERKCRKERDTPPDSMHEVSVDEEDRSKGTGDSYVALLTNQDSYCFNNHYTQHDGLGRGRRGLGMERKGHGGGRE